MTADSPSLRYADAISRVSRLSATQKGSPVNGSMGTSAKGFPTPCWTSPAGGTPPSSARSFPGRRRTPLLPHGLSAPNGAGYCQVHIGGGGPGYGVNDRLLEGVLYRHGLKSMGVSLGFVSSYVGQFEAQQRRGSEVCPFQYRFGLECPGFRKGDGRNDRGVRD